jgi:hypothetical protein
MAKAFLGSDPVNVFEGTKQQKYKCLLLVAEQQAAQQ